MSINFGANFKVHVSAKVGVDRKGCERSFSFEFYTNSDVVNAYNRILKEATKIIISMVGEKAYTIGDISITNFSNGD